MTVPLLFALLGSVILVGFLANLLFRLTKIPSVLVLISIGVVLGPVTGWIQHDSLLTIAPYFGAIALLVILFEGGLELEIGHVVKHAPRAAIFTALVFGLSFVAVAILAHFAFGFAWLQALMLGAILGATSPAICMPVVSGLSIRDDVKTVIKLESAMGEVLLIVSVVLLMQSHDSGGADASSWFWGFARSLTVAVAVATVAGVLWSRLVSWLGREPLSYMLTLGVTCLLYFVVEELGGSPAIAILVFGILLANMRAIASEIGPRFRELFGLDIREDQFVLGQFVMNITAELSFLVRTFFFVYLGLLLDFSSLSWTLALGLVVMYGLLLGSRRLGISMFRRGGASFSDAEWHAVMALQPRGLATAVVAFMPVQAGIAGVDLFPMFAFVVIVLSNLYMTGGILFAERQLRETAEAAPVDAGEDAAPAGHAVPPSVEVEQVREEPADRADLPTDLQRRPPLFSPARDFEDELAPANVTDWMARFFGIRVADREAEYADLIRASYLTEPLFWVQTFLGASICALGLIVGQPAIVIGAALIVPIVRPVVAMGLALASGDLLLLVKLVAKLFAFSALAIGTSAALVDFLPFALTMSEIAARTRPTVMDFLVALFGGMSGAALVSLRRQTIYYIPGAVIAITLVPALCVMGVGLTDNMDGSVFRGAGLQFGTNLFAAILGAGAILSLVGLPKAAQAPSIRQWKEEELAAPLARAVFGRLGLERTIGRTGSARARIIVVAIFLLALLTPLQLALNQLRTEFRIRQTIARAQEAFSVPNRSTVMGSSITLAEDVVNVRLQVATNELFAAQDIAGFEQRVSDLTGRRARLELVQTIADVGTTGTLGRLLSDRRTVAAEPSRSVLDSLQDASNRIGRILDTLPLPASVRIVSVRSRMGDQALPGLEVTYLAEQQMGDDARAMLAQLVAGQSGLSVERVSLQWMPALHTLGFTRDGKLAPDAAAALRAVQAALTSHPELEVSLALPSVVPVEVTSAVEQAVQRELRLATIRTITADPDSGGSLARLIISKPLS